MINLDLFSSLKTLPASFPVSDNSLSLSHTHTHTQRMDDVEDQEGVFHSYPCAYYVQSPSTISHANSADIRNIHNSESTYHSPLRSETFLTNPPNPSHVEASRFTLSRYSSSRGSNNSFLHEKKVAYDAQSHGTGTDNGENPLIIVDGGVLGDGDDENEDEDDEKEYYGRKRGFWRRYCTYRNSDSCMWICLQICWRAMVSLGVALIVFYLATKPPPPKVSVKVLSWHALNKILLYTFLIYLISFIVRNFDTCFR
jgi:hypothetical protein